MLPLKFTVNGTARECSVAPTASLLDVLRESLALRGTPSGCDTAQCGACTVLVDGRALKSCNRLALQTQGQDVLTIEGVAPGPDTLHPLQHAFSTHHALQCGYCTPGMVMRALAMRAEGVPPDAVAVREALAGNLCRCTGYQGIVDAIAEMLQGPLLAHETAPEQSAASQVVAL